MICLRVEFKVVGDADGYGTHTQLRLHRGGKKLRLIFWVILRLDRLYLSHDQYIAWLELSRITSQYYLEHAYGYILTLSRQEAIVVESSNALL